MRTFFILLFSFLVLVGVGSVGAAPRPEPLVEQVRKSIERSKDYLMRRPRDGHWDIEDAGNTGGPTCLVLLALLNAGVPPDDPVIERGLQWLRNHVKISPSSQTYVVGLETMVFCLAGKDGDRPRIQQNVNWLENAKVIKNGMLQGWTYTNQKGGMADNSNSQYAILGLHEAQNAGIPVHSQTWKEIGQLYMKSQVRDGWAYHTGMPQQTLTMTTAGLCGLLMASMDLNRDRDFTTREGHWSHCGVYKESENVAGAQKWLANHFPNLDQIGDMQHLFYCLYGLERAGRLTGLRFIGEHDWYRVGCQFLVRTQGADGSWHGKDIGESGTIIPTSFALLFLSKGRTPVLISKVPFDGVVGGQVFKAEEAPMTGTTIATVPVIWPTSAAGNCSRSSPWAGRSSIPAKRMCRTRMNWSRNCCSRRSSTSAAT